VNGCFTYQDESGPNASPSIIFPMPGGAEGYSPACLQVAVGQPVSFSGDFAGFPIVQTCGQSQPLPEDPNAAVIVQPDAGTWASYTFNAPGSYGYSWLFDAGVAGAIFVVP
jgi:plastocyanin